MTRPRPWHLAAAIAVGIQTGPATAQDAPPVETGVAVEIVEMLLGRDPSRYDTPLAAMHGRAELYSTYRDRAGADATSLALWLLLADHALRSADASLMQSYAADLLPVYEAGPERVLSVLRDAPWLAGATCTFLAGYFGSEDRPAEGREAFVAREQARIEGALSGPVSAECLARFEASSE